MDSEKNPDGIIPDFPCPTENVTDSKSPRYPSSDGWE